MLPIQNIIFVILLALATAYLTFLTTKGGLTDNRFSNLWKRLTTRGRLSFLMLLVISILLGLQEWNSQLINKKKEDELSKNEKERDSIITTAVNQRTEASRSKLFEDISLAFKKQNLKLDTVTKEISILKDSAHKTVIISENKRPTIEISPPGPTIEKRNGRTILVIPWRAFDAWAKIINTNTYIIIIDTLNQLHLIMKSLEPPIGHEFSETKGLESDLDLNNVNLELVKGLYIYLNGTYTDRNLKNIYTADVAWYYGIHTNNFSYLTGELRKKMIEFLKSKGQL